MNSKIINLASCVTLLAVFFLAAGCASNPGLINSKKGASLETAPRSPINVLVIDKIDPPGMQPATTSPAMLTMPATYRQVTVDGRTMLVRETDPRKVLTTPGVQVIAGDIANGDIAVQPGIMSQEIAAEIVRTRAQVDELTKVLPQVAAQMSAMNQRTIEMEQVTATAMLQLKKVADYAIELEKQINTLKAQQKQDVAQVAGVTTQ
jgi:hypothetical protein